MPASGAQTAVLTGMGTADDFGITASPRAQTIAAGNSTSYSVDITSISGIFSDTVTLSASGLPAGATVTFAPASVTPGTAGATSTMTIQTATLAARTTAGSPWPLGAPLLGAVLFIPFGLRRPASKLTRLMVLAVVTASLPWLRRRVCSAAGSEPAPGLHGDPLWNQRFAST